MWLRTLMKMLLWQPKSAGTAKLVQYLSETRPIRAAARATAYGILRGKHALEEGVTKPGRRAIDEARNRTDVDGNSRPELVVLDGPAIPQSRKRL